MVGFPTFTIPLQKHSVSFLIEVLAEKEDGSLKVC